MQSHFLHSTSYVGDVSDGKEDIARTAPCMENDGCSSKSLGS